MKFSLEMDLDNDAMNSSEELADALRRIATRIHDAKYVEQLNGEEGRDDITRGIMDVNGNTVGQWVLRNEQDDEESV
jgi:hypothetical protein